MLIIHQNVAHAVQSFDSFKANEIELYVANLELAHLYDSFSKEKYYRMESFGEIK